MFYFIAFASVIKHFNNRSWHDGEWRDYLSNKCDKMVSRWENIAQMNQYMEREEEKGAGVSIMNMDCEEKRHYLALCVCVCV